MKVLSGLRSINIDYGKQFPWRILLFSTIIKLILLLPSMLFDIDYLGKEIQMSSNYGNQLT